MTRYYKGTSPPSSPRYHPYSSKIKNPRNTRTTALSAAPSFHVLAPTAPNLPDESDSDDTDFEVDTDNSELDTDHESEVDDIPDGADNFIPRVFPFVTTSTQLICKY